MCLYLIVRFVIYYFYVTTLSKRHRRFCRAIRAPSRRFPRFCRADRSPWVSQPRIIDQIATWNYGSEAGRQKKVQGCDVFKARQHPTKSTSVFETLPPSPNKVEANQLCVQEKYHVRSRLPIQLCKLGAWGTSLKLSIGGVDCRTRFPLQSVRAIYVDLRALRP